MEYFKRKKAEKWAKNITKKNMAETTPLNCTDYIHPTDKATLNALKKIPLFDTLCSKVLSFLDEPKFRILDMSGKIHITENQFPKMYHMVKSICNKINIDMPDLYLELNRFPNACTYGTEHFSITVTSGLLESMEDDELYAVLAHECGHIACQHVLYHTVGRFILNGGNIGLNKLGELAKNTLVGGIITTTIESSLELAFYHWQRCSELSADRVAALCCGGSNPVIETMMRLSGGTTNIGFEIDRDQFIAQAEEYNKLTLNNKTDKFLEYLLVHNQTHPLLAVRAYEIQKWSKTEEFRNAIK